MSRKTVAGLLLFGIIFSLFVSYLANTLAYTLGAIMNSSQAAEPAYESAGATPSTGETSLGNYTVVYVEPSTPVYKKVYDLVVGVGLVFLKALSEPIVFAILVSLSILVYALSRPGL